MSDPRFTPARSAWDYGLPQGAVEQVDETLRDVLGYRGEPRDTFPLGDRQTDVVFRNVAAAIVRDLITSGAMSPGIPDTPPPEHHS